MKIKFITVTYMKYFRDSTVRATIKKGFALVSCLLIMSLLMVLAAAVMTLSSVEVGHINNLSVQHEARANARLALQMAIAQLQELTGSDQVVTARSDIFSNDVAISNSHWTGAWKTTYQIDDEEIKYPLIGQKTATGNNIYAYNGAYSDLRSTEPLLANDRWKKELLEGWLVSSPAHIIDPSTELHLKDPLVVELLGKGSLGSLTNEDNYSKQSVRVKKISISGGGSVAWWTSDNNQKACVKPIQANSAEHVIGSGLSSDLSFIRYQDSLPFIDYHKLTIDHKDKVISLASANLAQDTPSHSSELLKYYAHDLTHYAPGMYTSPVLGGFQRDLTPLLFARSGEKTISFESPFNRLNAQAFHSEYPIISSSYHDVLAPTFSALRYWGLQKYTPGNVNDTHLESFANRERLTQNWPHSESDGITHDVRHWASEMPKTHPIMTDIRWHYYFSINGGKLRTHIIPRVCLWNPYNREIKIDEMVVMMPNPFFKTSGGFHFYVEDDEVERLKFEMLDLSAPIHSWVKKNAAPLGLKYKARLSNTDLFPQRRYLIFTLKDTTLTAGECHVFSAKSDSSQLSSANVNIALYDSENISNNILSSDSAQGGDHFYIDVDNTQFEIQTASSWKTLSAESQNNLNLETIHDYRPETGVITDNFPFVLKASNGAIPSYDALLKSSDHPTLQLINNGTGGVAPSYYFAYSGSSWGSANTIGSFGSLQTFQDAPYKDAPATHQVGAKMIWLDESTTEGNKAPLRYGTSSQTRWAVDHMVYHPATIANWNVRANLTSRSPVAQCAQKWYLFSTGPWILQFIPKSPQDTNDAPQLNDRGTAFVKNPFGLSIKYAVSQNVVLFDLPHSEYGAHSLGSLRHAMLSPYSWHPSYIVGQSIRDPHSPAVSSAHPEVILSAKTSSVSDAMTNHWDEQIGGYRASYAYGAANEINDSDDLLQIGKSAVTRDVDGYLVTSMNDVLPYDIAFEVNQSIWDSYFISSLPLNDSTDRFSSIIPNSQQCEINDATRIDISDLTDRLTIRENAIDQGFWLNAYYYRKTNAFNVNSTSVPAWTAFLSGTLRLQHKLKNGSYVDSPEAGFRRYRCPVGVASVNRLEPEQEDAWSGMRSLSEDEISKLATAIVDEVKLRGPFISLADFVNRRLTDESDESSRMGALDAAIYKSALNQKFFDDPRYSTSVVDRGTDVESVDNNQNIFRNSYLYTAEGETRTSQAPIKTWGLPSFLMQSDILTALAPSLTTRGDTFTIRAYGESKRNGKVVATAYIEAIVERGPHYIDHQDIRDVSNDPAKNLPTDAALKKDNLTGDITPGNLTIINQKLGRKYRIKSFRWLNKNEI